MKNRRDSKLTNETFKTTKRKLLEYGVLGDIVGDAIRAGVGIVFPPGVVVTIGKNVREINGGSEKLEKAMTTFKTSPTIEGLEEIERGIDHISTDLLDLSSSLIQLLPDPTAITDIGAFATEQLTQLFFTAELPVVLDKMHPLIDAIPFVGKTDVVKAMDVVGEAHDLVSDLKRAMKEWEKAI